MEGLLKTTNRISRFLNVIAGVSLTFLMLLTITDVILRGFKRPVVGTYELVAFSGAVVIAFSLPFTSWVKGHVYVDFLIVKLSQKARNIFNIITRCLGIGIFLIITWNIMDLGMELRKAGEVSPTLHVPFYIVVYGIGICSFVQCLVLLSDIFKIIGGEYE